MNHKEIIERLKEGNKRFVEGKLTHPNQYAGRREELFDSQNPMAVVLTCSDSRIVPEVMFDTGLGDLFVVRVAGNIAAMASIATIEYAVENLHTPVVIIMGHQKCAAVSAALEKGEYGHHLNHLLTHIQPAIDKAGSSASVEEVILENACHSSREILTESESITKLVEEGSVKIIPAYYHMDTGKVEFLDKC